jgi:hypothetical protein
MFCTTCGVENLADAEFCHKCGKPLLTPQSAPTDHPAFGAAGLATIRRKKIAVTLLWVSIALSTLGILLRGLIPMDILLWMGGLGLAIWYTRKASPLLKVPRPQPTSEPLTAPTNSWLDAEGIGSAVVLVVAILFLVLSLSKWSDRELVSRPTSEATASRKHIENPKRTVTPEESKVLQAGDLMTLRPNEVIARCGKPLTDTTRIFTEAKIKGFLRRDISFKNEKGAVLTLLFWGGTDGHDWNFLSMFDGGAEYRPDTDDEVNHILFALPCMRE